MADIEELAEKYAEDHAPTYFYGEPINDIDRRGLWELIRNAYLAGSAQTQKDYVSHYDRNH